jgi:hypothetical protein
MIEVVVTPVIPTPDDDTDEPRVSISILFCFISTKSPVGPSTSLEIFGMVLVHPTALRYLDDGRLMFGCKHLPKPSTHPKYCD